MSTHDRGAFGQLLAEAKSLGCKYLSFDVTLDAADDDPERWACIDISAGCPDPSSSCRGANGRTGEEALRRLVEKLREASEIS